ncbi:hypothetical protein HAX54_029295 [Datura stramonium]|uniref:Uncharacterized protein n=1 Tax=Datura stramonium TaxID=4076 RepID=A0ABS8SA66_DATST|nr:hypothetical protein [Datura stramonium]
MRESCGIVMENKDKFEVCGGLKEHMLQGFVISTMQRLFMESSIAQKSSIRRKETPDKIWEIQHTRKNVNGERVWLDPQSQQIHGQLQQLVEQQSEEVEHPMTRDEILSSVLGERSGYVQGKGYEKKPPRKTQIQQADIEASVSSVMESMRQEMEAGMDWKLQEERLEVARRT